MLATLVIGLREGLEAALIVGIIAAFLRSNGKSLRPMWLGVGLAVALSIAVGVVLEIVERALPQSRQEAMESVIGLVAIFFVTTMIVWMNTHARAMRTELEAGAAEALGRGSAYALAVMAFLAVLREGFETSVFLLATFSAAQSAPLAVTGAVVGVLVAVGIGWGIYAGGVKINLGRFFRYTGAFLILVAAGLTITTLRTAHEAGWLNAGQQSTVDLSTVVAPGSVQSALITGVLGIPADPRLIEVIGWFAYLVPVALYVYWPRALRVSGRAVPALQAGIAAALAVAAVVLAVAIPQPRTDLPADAPLAATAGGSPATTVGTARLTTAAGQAELRLALTGSPAGVITLPAGDARSEAHDGTDATVWAVTDSATPASLPATLTLNDIIKLSGGRLPVGLNPREHPGPFTAKWTVHRATTVWARDGVLLDATQRSTAVVALTGSGLLTARTLSVDDLPGAGTPTSWQVSATYRDQAHSAVADTEADRAEHRLWARDVPVVLGIAALLLLAAAGRGWTRLRRAPAAPQVSTTQTTAAPVNNLS